MNESSQAKAALRAVIRARRSAIGEAERRQWDEAIAGRLYALPEFTAARCWFLYLSEADEVSTADCVDRLLARPDAAIHAPVIISRTEMEARRLRSRSELRPGRYGILAPLAGALLEGAVDVVLTPGLAFTAQGDRMGLGAGYYDRWFAAHPEGVRIALAYDCQMVDALPTEATDCPVDIIVTPSGVIMTGRRGSAPGPA